MFDRHGPSRGRAAGNIVVVGKRLQDEQVLDPRRLERGAHAGVVGLPVDQEREVGGRVGRVARVAGDGRRAEDAGDLRASAAHVGEEGDVVRHVVLGAQQQRLVGDLRPLPGLAEVEAGIGCGRHGDARGDEQRTGRRPELLVLGDEIQRAPEAIAAIVEGERADEDASRLLVERRVAAEIGAVGADAELAVVAIAPADIEVSAALQIGGVVCREARQVDIARPLRDHVDGATDAAGGRHAVKERRRAFQDFDALDVVREQPIVRRDAVDAVEGDLAGVAFADRKAANEEGVEDAAGLAHEADRSVVAGDVAHRHGLLVLDRLLGVAVDAERRVHVVAIAEHADAGTARHHAAGEVRRQVVDRARGRRRPLADDLHRIERRGGGRAGCGARARLRQDRRALTRAAPRDARARKQQAKRGGGIVRACDCR